jgi:hypothetical protein
MSSGWARVGAPSDEVGIECERDGEAACRVHADSHRGALESDVLLGRQGLAGDVLAERPLVGRRAGGQNAVGVLMLSRVVYIDQVDHSVLDGHLVGDVGEPRDLDGAQRVLAHLLTVFIACSRHPADGVDVVDVGLGRPTDDGGLTVDLAAREQRGEIALPLVPRLSVGLVAVELDAVRLEARLCLDGHDAGELSRLAGQALLEFMDAGGPVLRVRVFPGRLHGCTPR